MFSALTRHLRRGRPAPSTPLPPRIEAIRRDALKGHVLAQVQWGDVLLEGAYLTRNPAEARRWFAIAADAGFAPAHNMLGRCHHFGWGCTTDLTEAAAHYGRAGELGDAWGLYNLGILTMRGRGVTQDLATALALFRRAAAMGHAKSMNLIGRFTEEGWCTPRDPRLARDWYRRSAEGGDYRGQHNHATALAEQGDVGRALDWWRRAEPDATSDILLAMARHLTQLGENGDPTLLTRVQARLKAMTGDETPPSF
ncbi:hypothetical protein AA103196_1338 [Ameyamaea chiangmaiensis NBRC 103196]|uniref:Sel1 repeat family protein n=2 Tax=Ameyamaea chiangmaiensis TaxID=442969 RepID=A0A850P8G9_9PROT|nr:tetratricopeptide repeat protein [Ameyamaea chiangmaiensis]MBS4075160.1 sel1 repeat family protein [Ameyamaea chiangmaiensis]NVN40208.1 sel1 repeat family protein [Ameyamaea chiangmaiensis]GBQ66271.1 hypothetical protein AA103196_1338 [Ameyamaea chiangmaiensis NBRC 103196]